MSIGVGTVTITKSAILISLIFVIKHYRKLMNEEVVNKIFKIIGITFIILATYSAYLMI